MSGPRIELQRHIYDSGVAVSIRDPLDQLAPQTDWIGVTCKQKNRQVLSNRLGRLIRRVGHTRFHQRRKRCI